jgi:hypothetical protein
VVIQFPGYQKEVLRPPIPETREKIEAYFEE